jgi:hypothetical protein
MDTLPAYQWIFAHWYTDTWRPIPENIRVILGMNKLYGMYAGNIVSEAGANGCKVFCDKLNSINNKKAKG